MINITEYKTTTENHTRNFIKADRILSIYNNFIVTKIYLRTKISDAVTRIDLSFASNILTIDAYKKTENLNSIIQYNENQTISDGVLANMGFNLLLTSEQFLDNHFYKPTDIAVCFSDGSAIFLQVDELEYSILQEIILNNSKRNNTLNNVEKNNTLNKFSHQYVSQFNNDEIKYILEMRKHNFIIEKYLKYILGFIILFLSTTLTVSLPPDLFTDSSFEFYYLIFGTCGTLLYSFYFLRYLFKNSINLFLSSDEEEYFLKYYDSNDFKDILKS